MSEETKQNPKEENATEAPKPESIELVEGELDSVSGGWTWTEGGITSHG